MSNIGTAIAITACAIAGIGVVRSIVAERKSRKAMDRVRGK